MDPVRIEKEKVVVMRRLAAAMSLAAGLAVPALFPSSPAFAGRFEGTNQPFPKVLAQAKASKRPVLIDFVRPDCVWCTALDKETFSDARVAKALDGFVLARYDAETEGGRGLAQRYRVRGFPTLVVVDEAGAEVDRLVGFSPPEKFLAEMERIRAGEDTLPALAAKHAEDPDDVPTAVAYAKKLARGGDEKATTLLEAVAARAGASADDRATALSAGAAIALERGDSEAALAAWARVVEEAPKSAAADEARVARVRLLASEGSIARALEEADKSRGSIRDPAHLAALEGIAFRLQRAGVERTLVRWGESASEAKDGAALHAASHAALDAGLALGSALRWVERAADLTGRLPEVLDTWARLHAALLAFEPAVARGREAMTAGLPGPAREALAAALARWESVLSVPDLMAPGLSEGAAPAGVAGAPTSAAAPGGAAGPSGRALPVPAESTPAGSGPAEALPAESATPPSGGSRAAPADPCPPVPPAVDPCPPTGQPKRAEIPR